MKKSRLLEIIREEISSALDETLYSGPNSLKEPVVQKALSKMQGQEKMDAIKGITTGANPINLEEKDLEEDQLNERPFIDSAFDITGTSSEDLGKDPLQNAIDDAVKILKKENPDADVKRLAADIQKVNSPKNLGPQSKLSSEVKAALQKIADVIEKQGTIFGTKAKIDDLIKLTTNPSQIDRLEKLKEKGFTYVIGNPQAVTAVEKSLGLKPKNDDVLGASKDKPKAEPKAKAEKTPKAKVVTRTPGDDGFDNVSYSDVDSEDKEATQNIGKDKTAKDLGNLATGKEETFNRILGLVTKYKDDKAKVDAFISKAENEYKLPASLLKQLKLAAGRDVKI